MLQGVLAAHVRGKRGQEESLGPGLREELPCPPVGQAELGPEMPEEPFPRGAGRLPRQERDRIVVVHEAQQRQVAEAIDARLVRHLRLAERHDAADGKPLRAQAHRDEEGERAAEAVTGDPRLEARLEERPREGPDRLRVIEEALVHLDAQLGRIDLGVLCILLRVLQVRGAPHDHPLPASPFVHLHEGAHVHSGQVAHGDRRAGPTTARIAGSSW